MTLLAFAAALAHAVITVILVVLGLLLLCGLASFALAVFVLRDLYHLYLIKKELRGHVRGA